MCIRDRVNTEYQSKIMELTELNNDVENLLSAQEIIHLLLDENLEVRRFSPKITNLFKLLESDIGRPVTYISHYLTDCDPIRLMREVQDSGQSIEREVRTHEGRRYRMRVVPLSLIHI